MFQHFMGLATGYKNYNLMHAVHKNTQKQKTLITEDVKLRQKLNKSREVKATTMTTKQRRYLVADQTLQSNSHK